MDITNLKDKLSKRTPRLMETKKESAIFIPLVQWHEQLFLMFEVRSKELKHQPGEVCFPGGRRELGETPKQCVCRETAEELGIEEDEIEIYGQFDTLHNYTNQTIYTFIGTISQKALKLLKIKNNGKAEYISNTSEVQELFLVPLSYFLDTSPYVYPYSVKPDIGEDFPYDMIDSRGKYHWFEGQYTVPIFQYEENVIWGMTARILCHFLEEFKNG